MKILLQLIAKPCVHAFTLSLVLMFAPSAARAQTIAAATQDVKTPAEVSAADAARRLINRDALERQRAAEELARLADPQWRHLVEGYRLQEKNDRVRLALDWALYRMGKTEALFNVVRQLDSSRNNQSQAYLAQLESPAPLYMFLERVNGNTQIKLLEAFAQSGDAGTIERIKPYAASLDPKIADAAQFATREITRRLAQPAPNNAATRPRQTTESQPAAP